MNFKPHEEHVEVTVALPSVERCCRLLPSCERCERCGDRGQRAAQNAVANYERRPYTLALTFDPPSTHVLVPVLDIFTNVPPSKNLIQSSSYCLLTRSEEFVPDPLLYFNLVLESYLPILGFRYAVAE